MLALCVALTLQTAQSALPRWDVELRWTVGATDSGPIFAAIRSAAVDPSGTAYVLDSVDPFVHEISQSGRLVRSFGALGDGPGEFRQPQRLGWSGDRLVPAALFPPVASVGIGRNGWVWVQRTSSVADKTTELLVLSARGAVLGRVSVPNGNHVDGRQPTPSHRLIEQRRMTVGAVQLECRAQSLVAPQYNEPSPKKYSPASEKEHRCERGRPAEPGANFHQYGS